jgi:hypothetical protein
MPFDFVVEGFMERCNFGLGGGDFVVPGGDYDRVVLSGVGRIEISGDADNKHRDLTVTSVTGAEDPIVTITGSDAQVDGLDLDGISPAGDAVLIDTTRGRIDRLRVDTTRGGVVFGVGADDNQGTDWSIACGSATDNTYDAVTFADNGVGTGANRNAIANLNVSSLDPGVTDPRYGLVFAEFSGGNVVNGYRGTDLATGHVLDAGVRNIVTPEHTLAASQGGLLSVGAGTSRMPLDHPGEIINVRAMVDTAPSGGPATIDVNVNTTSVFAGGSEPTIADGTNDSGDNRPDAAATFAAGDYLRVDVDAANLAADLVVLIRVRQYT